MARNSRPNEIRVNTGSIDPINRNDNFFYDSQYIHDSSSWSLFTGEWTGASKNEQKEILRGVMTDSSFGFSVTHSYGEINALGVVTDAANKIANGVKIASTLGTYAEGLTESLRKSLGEGALSNQLGGVLGGLREMNSFMNKDLKWLGGNSFNDIAWGKFLSAIDQIKVFNGTNINIDIPTLKVTYFNNDEGRTTTDRIKDLNKYLIGEYSTGDGTLGILNAPNGYHPDFSNKEKPALASYPGTFTLYLGTSYRITNLVITNYAVEFSTVKHRGTNHPLYVDISVSLDIASYVDREKLNECITKY